MTLRKGAPAARVLAAAAAVLVGFVLLSSCCTSNGGSMSNGDYECVPLSPFEVIRILSSGSILEINGLEPYVPEGDAARRGLRLRDATTAGCSGVNFLEGGLVPLANASLVAGLQRQPDGSFTGWEYNKFAPFSFVQSSPVTFNCSGLGTPTFKNPPGWTPLKTQLGTTSQPIVASNLLGNGTPVGLAIVPAGFNSGGIFVGQPATTSLMVIIPNPDGSMKSHAFYPVPPGAQSILAGDFNNDGKLDAVVIGNSNSNSVGVYLGNGDGTLQSPSFFSGHQGTAQAVAYDFNGDGKLDLAVVNAVSNDVSILLGNGDGTFATAVNYPDGITGTGQIVAGDFDGDGHEDVAVSAGSSISVLLNKGNGAFGAPVNTPVVFNSVAGLAAGDFNKDGKLDVALTDSVGGTLSILFGDGAGRFPTEHDYAAGNQPRGLFAMDLDGDGNLDVVLASGHPDLLIPNQHAQFITVFFGLGDGTLTGAPAFHAGTSPNAIAIADFNGDGILDAASATGQLWIGVAGKGPVSINLGSGVSASGVAAADVNGDGKPDIVVGDASGSGVYVLLGKGDGTFQTPVKYSTGGGDVNSVAIADFNGDGKPDIAFCGFVNLLPPVGAAGILFGNGDGSFQAVTSLSGFGSTPAVLAVGDFNHDGKPDLAIVDQGYQSQPGGVNVYLNKGNGTFQTPVGYTAGQYPVFMASSDVSGDGIPDLIVSAKDPNYNTNFQWDVAVLLAKGDGTFKAPSYLATQINPNAIAIGDLNGDGKPDLAIGHCCAGSSITYMLGNGDGTFQAEAAVGTQVAVTSLAAANLGGKGPADLIAGSGFRGGYVSYFLNLGDLGTAITVQTSPSGLQFSVDGGAAQTAPQTLNLTQGPHTIAVASPQAGPAGTRYVFGSWSDGTVTTTDGITVGSSPATYTATFTPQYQLTTSVSPTAGGTVTPATGGFYDAGSAVPIVATANTGFTFGNWTGTVANSTSASTTVTMIAAESVVANFLPPTAITIQTNPPGLQFSVNGGAIQTAPQT
ncbi:MAG TPA: FG-GAP-like repeat-containing protein, partial [Bryobacteraceae bacterium]|nr:FG-GAP-like repeat-containing protein [Bryobacteraceae bacterium]